MKWYIIAYDENNVYVCICKNAIDQYSSTYKYIHIYIYIYTYISNLILTLGRMSSLISQVFIVKNSVFIEQVFSIDDMFTYGQKYCENLFYIFLKCSSKVLKKVAQSSNFWLLWSITLRTRATSNDCNISAVIIDKTIAD